MNRKNLMFRVDIPDNQLALAVGTKTVDAPFEATNLVFSTVFSDIQTPGHLYALISNKSENKTVIKFNEGFWELLEIKINSTDVLFLLKNISFEMLALVQLKKQLKELASTNTIYSRLLDRELPIGIMIIDPDYNILYSNLTLKRLFHIPSMLNLKKCFNYVKELKPCKDCILEGIQKGIKKKKSFTMDDRVITAEVNPSDDKYSDKYNAKNNKYIITFRETTREVGLIKQIKKQQEELETANLRIADQNDILKRLSNINIRIGQIRNLEAILETMLDAIIGTFSCKKGAVLLFNKSGIIKNAHFSKNISEFEREAIIKSIEPDLQTLDDSLGFYHMQNIVDTIGDNEELVGRLFLYKPSKALDQSILELFLMQITVYMVNLELHRKLEEVAHTDSLTGVFSRYYFEKRFNEEKELSLRFGQPLSLILLDVNGLKRLNDTIGHDAGDRLLKRTAQLLAPVVGSAQSIFRIGGDEFVLLLSNCPETQLNQILNQLTQLQESSSFTINDHEIPVRFSFGGVCSTNTSHDLLKDEADRLMYLDKKSYYKTHKKYR
jgi:diguanylate cyclase (GGDEF)-like protein